MTTADLVPLLPLIVISASAIIVLLVIAFARNHRTTAGLTLAGFALAFLALLAVRSTLPRQVTPLLILDSYAFFYMGLLFAAGFAVTLLAYGYYEKRQGAREEFYLLLLLATLGSSILVASSHFASFFLGLEILSVSLYVMIAYLRTDLRSIEAGIKYLVLAAVSAAFLLFGMALVYADQGTMEMAKLAALFTTQANAGNVLLLSGLALMVVGVGFKLAVVPFHMWTPDIYEGAPAPATAFVASVSKGGMFAFLLRYFVQVDARVYSSVFLTFALIAIASMLAGNLLALLQDNVKRILAYSSIAHLGYLLVAFLAGGPLALTAATFYLVAYFVNILAAFGVVSVLSGSDRDADTLDDYRNLFWRRPWLAGILTAALLSLAGIPLTAGFISKFYVLTAGTGAALWLLAIVLVISSAIGLFYYLRIIVAMYMREPEEAVSALPASLSLAGSSVLAVLTLLLVCLGTYPAPLVRIIEATVTSLP